MEINGILRKDASFRYQLLGRMGADCLYYLGNGGRCAKHLWAGNVPEQIAYMKAIYNSFPDGEKPDWMSMEEILDYEQRMLEPVLSVEEFKAKQNEILLQYGGRLPEACEEMNSLNLHFIRTHSGWMGGNFNKGILEIYEGRKVYNFEYDFMFPQCLGDFYEYMRQWKEKGLLSALQMLQDHAEKTGVLFCWA